MECCKPFWQLSDQIEKLGIIPDVLDTKPNKILSVTYEGNNKVSEGNILTPTIVKDKPVVFWNTEDDESLFLLAMVDPDAPSRENPKSREWHHWLVGNIPGNNIQLGETLSEYIGAGPPEGTDLHRYVFLLYKQLEKLTFDEPKLTNRSANRREKFSMRCFATKYNLGDPIAANFFLAEWDDYVPLLYQKLAGETLSTTAASKSRPVLPTSSQEQFIDCIRCPETSTCRKTGP
ncbi:hypothetical protein FQR65_LT11988 [Abscondita terminalis]|nr:hypothetical protein FQR65_LT11988 [Abscondita terminalis]